MNAERKAELRRKVDAGVKAAAARAVEEHRRAGQPIVIWENGRGAGVRGESHDEMILRDKSADK